MLGKRARSIHRNASSFSFMDLHLPRPTTTSPPPPPPFPQVVGFNPSHNRSDIPIRFNPFTPPDRPPFSADPPSPAPRSSVFRRSALQTLLAAARQAVELKDNCSDAVMVSPPLAGAARTYFLSQSEDFQESTASQASDEANETLRTDIDFSTSSPEKKCLLISVDQMSNSNHGPTPVSFNREVNLIGTAKEGRGNSLSESCHFLFLATSPLTDATSLSPMMNFLDSCYLCKRPLGYGLDIFMYRGGTAFCSAECRYSQILMDERKEKPSPSMLRSGSGSASSSYLHVRNRRSLVMQSPAGTAAAA